MLNTILVDGVRKTCRIYDNGVTADQYTIAFRGYRDRPEFGGRMIYPYLAAGPQPSHPQGFGQHGESAIFLTGKHLGKRVAFESLPSDVKKFILYNI